MSQENTAPELICFRKYPKNWLEHPPLASSLQTFETALMLIMMGRFPSALIECVSTTESVLKAAFKIKPNDIIKLTDLVIMACKSSPELSVRKKSFDKLRHARNTMMHYGYSPRDDAESTKHMLAIGFDFLGACYKTFFNFDLMDSLVIGIAHNLGVGIETFGLTKDADIDHSYCFIPLMSTLKQYLQPNFKPNWEYEALEYCDSHFIGYDKLSRLSDKYEKLFNCSWKFCCPICGCGDNHLIAEVDSLALDAKQIKLNRAVCCKCDLVIPFECPELANVLLKDEIEREREAILKDYGLLT